MADALAKQIDALYQLPLADFTPARNALASTAGPRKAEIQQLKKPKPAAWAVNQVFWRHRAAFDALVAASLAVRQAHVARVNGKDADIHALEARHAKALDVARRHASAALGETGTVSPATMEAVDKTLAALPAPEATGRLVEPLETVGFGLLSGLLATKGPDLRGMGSVVSLPGRKQKSAADGNTARATARLHREERRRLEKRLAAATAAESATRQAFARGRQAAERAEARIDRLEADLRNARAEAEHLRLDLDRLRGEANDAAAERVEAERALRLLGD